MANNTEVRVTLLYLAKRWAKYAEAKLELSHSRVPSI
jgi:hypothetical protein